MVGDGGLDICPITACIQKRDFFAIMEKFTKERLCLYAVRVFISHNTLTLNSIVLIMDVFVNETWQLFLSYIKNKDTN